MQRENVQFMVCLAYL